MLAPLLGLDGDQFLTTDQVRYVRGLETATALVDSGEAGSAFLLRAPTVEQVQAVAAAGRVMPQKSTYFFPKLATGFLLNPLAARVTDRGWLEFCQSVAADVRGLLRAAAHPG